MEARIGIITQHVTEPTLQKAIGQKGPMILESILKKFITSLAFSVKSQSQQPTGFVARPDPPTIHSVSTRGCCLSWTLPGPNIDFYFVVLEMCDARYGSNFVPIPDEFYATSRTFANVLNLMPSREYRFRLSIAGGQQQLYSDLVSVKTHRDFRSYASDGSSLYYSVDKQEVHHRPYLQRQTTLQQQQFHATSKQQNVEEQQQLSSIPHPVILAKKPATAEQQQLQTPRQLQRSYDNGECLVIGWKYGGSGSSSAIAKHISFIVEGSCNQWTYLCLFPHLVFIHIHLNTIFRCCSFNAIFVH